MNTQALRVSRRYEAKTPWMLARGTGRGEAVIHRPLWLAGVPGRSQAVHSVDAPIRDTLAAAEDLLADGGKPPRRLDLGRGPGGTAVWRAERLLGEITGITLSPVQVRRARELAKERRTAESCGFVEGDFPDEQVLAGLDDAGQRAKSDAVYPVEAFSYASDPRLFFARVAAQLISGGLLILCDDFASDGVSGSPRRGGKRRRERWLQAFRRGWCTRSCACCRDADPGSRASGVGPPSRCASAVSGSAASTSCSGSSECRS